MRERLRWDRAGTSVQAIRALVAPHGADLDELDARSRTRDAALEAMSPPDGFERVHSLLRSALQLGAHAFVRRHGEAGAPGAPAARNAASAAAGALMLFDQVGDEVDRLLMYPELS